MGSFIADIPSSPAAGLLPGDLSGRLLDSFNHALLGALIHIGDRNGLFGAMADGSPLTPHDLALRTGQSERYLAEWLAALACTGFVIYDSMLDAFCLPAEVAECLVDGYAHGSGGPPLHLGGLFALLPTLYRNAPAVAEAFGWGTGIQHSAFDADFESAFGRATQLQLSRHLVRDWIGQIDGLDARLRAGRSIADIGCGQGGALLTLAEAYPQARLAGYDCSPSAIEVARLRAIEAGHDGRLQLEVRDASAGVAGHFDLICAFYTVHCLVDPLGCLHAVHDALSPDGVFLWVELDVGDGLAGTVDGYRGAGRLAYSLSTLYGLTVSLADGGMGLGAMGEAQAESLIRRAGFRCFRRLDTDDAFSAVYEARV